MQYDIVPYTLLYYICTIHLAHGHSDNTVLYTLLYYICTKLSLCIHENIIIICKNNWYFYCL